MDDSGCSRVLLGSYHTLRGIAAAGGRRNRHPRASLQRFPCETFRRFARAEVTSGVDREYGRRPEGHEVAPEPLARGFGAFGCLVHCLELRRGDRGGWGRPVLA